ncbi:MAG: response regulator [Nanoarchaeota archaeon]
MAKKNILIVEDDADMQMIYKDIIKNGYSVIAVSNVEDARKELKKKKADLMILDIILPKVQGDTFFSELKSSKQYKDMPIIVISVIGDLTPQLRQIDPKVVSIAKPFKKEELLAAIDKKLK